MDNWWAPVTLRARHVRLEPLSEEHVDDLFDGCADADVWRWMPVAAPSTVDDMRVVVGDALRESTARARIPFAIIEQSTGRAIGSTSYLDVVPAHRRIEIGWTWLGKPWWRTAANTEAKLLLLGHAFDTLQARRVALKTDVRNDRSQAAIGRLGAQREGVLRSHIERPDGSRRDTVYFSILSDEWPGVRERLEARVQRHAGTAAYLRW